MQGIRCVEVREFQKKAAAGRLALVCVLALCGLLPSCFQSTGHEEAGKRFVTVTTTSLPTGTVGQAYTSTTLQASGGATPYSWKVSAGALPAGLSLSSAGVLGGTPTTAGSANFTVQVSDSSFPKPLTATQAFTVTISAAVPALTITTTSLPNGTVGSAYSQTLQASGGTTPYSWLVTQGTLPAGLTLSSAGVLSGTPSAAASATFTVQAKDSSNPAQTASQQLTVAISAIPITYSQSQIFAAGLLVALDDDGGIAVVGNPNASGSATVFVNNSGTWSQATQLNNSDNAVVSVAVSGDGNTIVVGSCALANCKGHTFVYSVASGAWPSGSMNPTATLSASNAQANGGDRIGSSVATDEHGDTIATGSPCDYTAGILLCGTVYVYLRPATGWASNTESAQLTVSGASGAQLTNGPASSSASTPTVGFSVSMDSSNPTDSSAQTIVAGAPGVEASPTPGALYVFAKPSSGWATTSTATVTLTESTPNNGDGLGWSAAISSDGHTIVSGAPSYPNNQSCSPSPCNMAGPGAAFVFVNPSAPSAWTSKTEDATLTGKNGTNQYASGSPATIVAPFSEIVVA